MVLILDLYEFGQELYRILHIHSKNMVKNDQNTTNVVPIIEFINSAFNSVHLTAKYNLWIQKNRRNFILNPHNNKPYFKLFSSRQLLDSFYSLFSSIFMMAL